MKTQMTTTNDFEKHDDKNDDNAYDNDDNNGHDNDDNHDDDNKENN